MDTPTLGRCALLFTDFEVFCHIVGHHLCRGGILVGAIRVWTAVRFGGFVLAALVVVQNRTRIEDSMAVSTHVGVHGDAEGHLVLASHVHLEGGCLGDVMVFPGAAGHGTRSVGIDFETMSGNRLAGRGASGDDAAEIELGMERILRVCNHFLRVLRLLLTQNSCI